jgi:hypothetical protein
MLRDLAAAEEAERVAEEKRWEEEKRQVEEERRRAKEEEMQQIGEARRKIEAENKSRMKMAVVVNKQAPSAGLLSPSKAGLSAEVDTDCWFCRSKGFECVQKV